MVCRILTFRAVNRVNVCETGQIGNEEQIIKELHRAGLLLLPKHRLVIRNGDDAFIASSFELISL